MHDHFSRTFHPLTGICVANFVCICICIFFSQSHTFDAGVGRYFCFSNFTLGSQGAHDSLSFACQTNTSACSTNVYMHMCRFVLLCACPPPKQSWTLGLPMNGEPSIRLAGFGAGTIFLGVLGFLGCGRPFEGFGGFGRGALLWSDEL